MITERMQALAGISLNEAFSGLELWHSKDHGVSSYMLFGFKTKNEASKAWSMIVKNFPKELTKQTKFDPAEYNVKPGTSYAPIQFGGIFDESETDVNTMGGPGTGFSLRFDVDKTAGEFATMKKMIPILNKTLGTKIKRTM
jgi:hypothetical protein